MSIWSPVATSGWRGSGARCEANSDPLDQQIGERMTAASPSGSRAPGPAERRRPDEDRDADEPDDDAEDGQAWQPLAEEDGRRRPPPRPASSRSAGPRCPTGPSARRRRPCPSRRRAAAPPTIAESRHSRRVGQAKARPVAGERPRRAGRDRRARSGSPAMRNGGIVSTAMAIAEVRRAPHEVEDEHARARSPALALGRGGGRRWHRWMVQGRRSVRRAGWPSPVGQPSQRCGARAPTGRGSGRQRPAPDAGRHSRHGR